MDRIIGVDSLDQVHSTVAGVGINGGYKNLLRLSENAYLPFGSPFDRLTVLSHSAERVTGFLLTLLRLVFEAF